MRKRALDLVIGLPAALLSAPVVAVIALAIRLETPGHPIYTQTRVGRAGEPFRIYKLRTMVAGAERKGALRPGMRVVEYTGGSTGSSLALVCAVKGYCFTPISSDAFAREKLDTMRAFGGARHELGLISISGISRRERNKSAGESHGNDDATQGDAEADHPHEAGAALSQESDKGGCRRGQRQKKDQHRLICIHREIRPLTGLGSPTGSWPLTGLGSPYRNNTDNKNPAMPSAIKSA